MKPYIALGLIALAGCSGNAPPSPPGPPPPPPGVAINPIDYLAQNVCNDGSIPAPNCLDGSTPGEATTTSTLTQRRGDWGPNDTPYAFSDGVQGAGYALTTWAFGGDTSFVQSHGDGGEIYAANGGNWVITSTQDGGTPQMQYFVGGTGWIVSPLQVVTCDQGWTTVTATLNISLGAPTPPPSLNQATTRSCLFPGMQFPAIANGQHITLTADTLISEHYGSGGDPSTATSLERSWFAKGYGRIGWAAWVVGAPPVDPSRYPSGGLPLNNQTMPNAVMGDVRVFTNFVTVAPFNVSNFGWP